MEQITIDPTATELKYRKTKAEFIKGIIPPILIIMVTLPLSVWGILSTAEHFIQEGNQLCADTYGSGAYLHWGTGLCIVGKDAKRFPGD